jgi:protein TonB
MITNNSNLKIDQRADQPGSDETAPRILTRTVLGTPAALMVTAALGMMMAGMIRVEYQALDEKPEKLSFIINEEVPDIDITRTTEIPVLRSVEVPPPPPTLNIPREGLPTTETVEIDTLPPPPPKPHVDLGHVPISAGDRNPQPILRIPPTMPPRFAEGDNSGRCKVRFDVSAQGSPYNVVTTYCSSRLLERPTIKSVLKWKFRPKIQNGIAVAMNGLENEVVFQLTDARGNLLPEI